MTVTIARDKLYLANAAVLLVHQMDAAFWHEWTLFHLPGALAGYLLLNLPICAIVLYGYGTVVARRPTAVRFSWLLTASGLFAVAFHSWYLAGGDPAFRTTISLALLAATLLLSVLQASDLLRSRDATVDRGNPT